MKKWSCLPKEGLNILLAMVVVGAIFILTGCGTLTTVESCEKEIDKDACIERVHARQNRIIEREHFDRR